MQLYTVLSLALAGAAIAKPCYNSSEPAGHSWWPAQLGDSRSPCPMLNSLANHAFLPRNGKNLDQSTIASALSGALNFPVEPFLPQIQGGLTHSSTGKNGTFNLEDLVHKPMEHDGSLSRNDAYWGDALRFDPLIWATTAWHFIGKDVISIETAAKARADRIAAAEALNPDFNLTETQMTTSYAESGLYLLTFGNKVTGDAKTEWVKIMFEQERLPYAEGWRRANSTISAADIGAMVKKILAVGA